MKRWHLAVGMLLGGCGGGFDPTGEYEGALVESGADSRMTSDLQPDAAGTMDVRRYNRSRTQVVVVRRVDPRHLEVDIGGDCKLRVEHMAEPNDDSALIPEAPEQRCTFTVEGFSGELTMHGTADFTRQDPPTLTLAVTGMSRSGDPNRAGYHAVDHTISFTAPRRPR